MNVITVTDWIAGFHGRFLTMSTGTFNQKQMETSKPAIIIDPQILEEGRLAQRDGRVLECQLDSDEVLVGKVRRDQAKPYAVVVQSKGNPTYGTVLEGRCTCSRSFNCDHVAAVVIDHFGSTDALQCIAPARAPDMESTESSVDQTAVELAKLSVNVQTWLQLLLPVDDAHPQGRDSYPTGESRRLTYTISPQPDQPHRILIMIGIGNADFNGRIREVRHLAGEKLLYSSPGFLQPSDIKNLQMLQSFSPGGLRKKSEQVPVSLATEIVKSICATGRAYWKRTTLPPLKPGPERTGVLEWCESADGHQYPGIRVEPAAVLISGPECLYVDPVTYECGAVKTNIPPMQLMAWLTAPPIPVGNTEAIAKCLKSTGLPAPLPTNVEIRNDEVPVPFLRLNSAVNPWYSDKLAWRSTEKYVHFAEFWLEYAGHRVMPESTDDKLRIRRPEGMLIIRRNKIAESKIAASLANHGLRERPLFYYHGAEIADKSALTVGLSEGGDAEDWKLFVQRNVPQLEHAGWRIQYDPGFVCRTVNIDNYYLETTGCNDNNWFDVELGVEVDGERINILPLLRAALAISAKSSKTIPIHLPDGRNIVIPRARLEKILGVMVELLDPAAQTGDKKIRVDRLRAAQLALIDRSWQWNGDQRLKELGKKLNNFSGLSPVRIPAVLKAELRSYQREGLNWLQFLREHELSGVLADDMGLGKTVQTLAHIACEKEAGRLDRPALVIAPTSVIHNWRAECERFAPDLNTLVLHGPSRHAHFPRVMNHDLVLTTYPLLARDADELKKHRYHLLIMDEAQLIKNPRTYYAQSARELETRHRLCLSGTPLENHLGELWALYDFLLPGFLGDAKSFRRIFRDPIEKSNDTHRRGALAKRIGPLILRRRKQEVAKELPTKTEVVRTVELAGDQLDLYESIRSVMQSRVEVEIAAKGLSRSHIVILDALLKLRQVCCDPRLVKLPSAEKVRESAKLEYLMQILPPLIEEGRKVLLFSQFTGMLDLIEEEIVKRQIDFLRLDGQTTDRQTPVAKFQAGYAPLFLISLKAGGTGLNLTAADTVIHYDPWWNPAVENQATDRTHRIGQDKPVFIYKLIAKGTVEEKIQAMQARKAELAEGLLNDGAGKSLQLTGEDLRQLFAPLEKSDGV